MAYKNVEKAKENKRKYYATHKKVIDEYNKKWGRAHPERKKVWNIKRAYDLTLEQIDEILITQDNKCAICGVPLKEGRGRHIDHDHKTGVVRGILCQRCNVGLWPLEDKEYLEKALVYLLNKENHAANE